MKGEIQRVLKEKLTEALSGEVSGLTRRDIRVPKIPGKATAVVGMRRSGKSCFLHQCLGDFMVAGVPRKSLLLLNFEDERLAGMEVSGLSFLLEEYYRRHPEFRDAVEVVLFLDEIQLVPGWERFARRILDSEKVRLFVSGSSAAMLSREVATSMRGRAMEVRVFPFSFREVLRHRGEEPGNDWDSHSKAQRSAIEKALRGYLVEGGFPEAQGIDARDRRPLLQSYVDVAILRDVIERHGVSNPIALRWLQRHLLSSPAAPFSIQKFYHALKSQGLHVSKDSLHLFLGYIEDAFLVRTVSLLAASERRRMVNPRKAYPTDPGLIPIYELHGRRNLGHALETAVLIELQRREFEVHYLRTRQGNEVDFHALGPLGETMLVQVCADPGAPETMERECRSLLEARDEHPEARLLLVHLEPLAPDAEVPEPIEAVSASRWLLEHDRQKSA